MLSHCKFPKHAYLFSASTACPSGWTGFEGICYISHTTSAGVSWDEALATCQRLGTGNWAVLQATFTRTVASFFGTFNRSFKHGNN